MDKKEQQRRQRHRANAQALAKALNDAGGFEPTAVKLPKGIDWLKLEVGTLKVDILPYTISSKFNRRGEIGYEAFDLEYHVHRVPGANGRQSPYICPYKCFGKKPCPICQLIANENGSELAKSLVSTQRHLWVVNDKPGNFDNPLKVFDSNYRNRGMGFGEMLSDALKSDESRVNFFELERKDGGLSLQFTVKEQTMPGRKWNAVTRIDFLPRKYDYSEDILDRIPDLDACLIEHSYQDLYKLVHQGEMESPAPVEKDEGNIDDGDEDSQNGSSTVLKTAKELGLSLRQYVEYEGQLCQIVNISTDGRTIKLKGEDNAPIGSVSPEEVHILRE